MMRILLTIAATAASLVSAATVGPRAGQIKNLVTFGDSYTDVVVTGDGGAAWPTYAAGYGPFRLFPFARSGATCSNKLTLKPFPSLFESQLPTFFSQKKSGSLRVNQAETIYTLWIGTNDVGVGALLTGDQTKGVALVDVVGCAVNWIKTLYASGARNFLFQNMIPLENTILYNANTFPNRFWTIDHNATEWSVFMNELTTSGNAIAKLMLQALAPTLPGAHIGLFDSHALFTDIIAHPRNYLNGTAAPNLSGAVQTCVFERNAIPSGPGTCTTVTGRARDSFLWFDELHPSEQANRVVARQITNAIQRRSEKFTTWFS